MIRTVTEKWLMQRSAQVLSNFFVIIQHQTSHSQQEGELCTSNTHKLKDALIPYPITTIIFVLLFIRIIFGYTFEYNLCKNVRFFENKNMKREFNFCGNGYDCGDLFSVFNYGVSSLVPAPPSPTLFDFNVLHVGLRGKLALKYLFGVNNNGNDFGDGENKNVEIVKCEVDFGDLFYRYFYPPTSFPTLAPSYSTTTFNGIDNGLSKINIVKSVFDVIDKYGVEYDMDSETLDGMFCFWFFNKFFSGDSL